MNKLKGGKADKLSVEDIAKKHKVSVQKIKHQLEKGKKVELEHVNDKKLATEIAMDHLSEIPDYYTRLEKMESNAKKNLKENINDFSKRMRELAGFSEGIQKKSLKTIQEGVEFDSSSNEEYEIHEFEQKKIEESETDEELYTLNNLNENTIIVLDFLNESKDKKQILGSYEQGYDSNSINILLKNMGANLLKNKYNRGEDISIWQLPEKNLRLKVIKYSELRSYYETADYFFEIFKKNSLNLKKELTPDEINYANDIINILVKKIDVETESMMDDYSNN